MTQKEYETLFDKAYNLYLQWQSNSQNKTIEEVKLALKQKIIVDVFKDESFKIKLNGMAYRNKIPLTTQITEDILQEVCYQLMKCNDRILVEAYCEDYSRIFALSITIATRVGFSKMSKEVHPNASLAKQMMFKSNLNTTNYLSTTQEKIIDSDKEYDLPLQADSDIWHIIKENLTEEQNQFLDFLLDKVLDKKYSQAYSRDLRRNYYSYNEYRILRLELQNRIKEIINDL